MIMTVDNDCVSIPCTECGRALRFRIESGIVVGGEGRIACNLPAAVCDNCVDRLLQRVGEPGLLCFDGLSAILAQEIVESFPLLLPKSVAVAFFQSLFRSEE